MSQILISSLHYYPVKSCRGKQMQDAIITERGFEFDRAWLVVNESGMFLTQREFADMSLIIPEVLSDGNLRLSAPNVDSITVSPIPNGESRRVRVWDDECDAIDQGEMAAQWFSAILKLNCRLVTMGNSFVRAVDRKYATGEQQVGFADGFPFLLISEESLDDLNEKLEYPVPMNRFRPNIVIQGCKPFEEDTWKTIRIGELEFDVVKPCSRCVITTIEQDDAVRGKEPLRTLANYRKVGNKIMFGQNLVHHKTGKISVGDTVEVLRYK